MDDIVKLEVRLLLLRHGRRKVVQALATLSEQTFEQVEAEISGFETRKTKRTHKIPSAVDLLGEFCNLRPDSADALRILAHSYDNRTFLPQLRDVKRFLDRYGIAHKALRSRRAATRELMIALSRLSNEMLNQLAKSPDSRDSGYAELAQEIMGKR